MPYEKNLGSNIMPKVIPEYGVFVGVKFNEYFGLEFGYEWSKKVKGKKLGRPGDKILNVTIVANSEYTHNISYKRTGYKFHVVFNSPKFINNEKINVNAFLGTGLTWQRISIFELLEYKIFVPFFDPIKREIPQNLISNKRTHVIPEMKAGLSIEFNNLVGIRPYVSWTRTAKLGQFDDNVPDGVHFTL